jgi:uncharacterized protein (DUF58 family)
LQFAIINLQFPPVLFPPDLMRRFRHLSLQADRSSAAKRGTAEAAALRDYSPGDDYRHIDWAWCARRDELMTRVFPRHADPHFYILVDCSPSMGMGSPSKLELAKQIAAAAGYAALARLDRLGVAAFCEGLVAGLPLLRHDSRLPRLLHFLEEFTVYPGQTNLARAAEAFTRRPQRPGPVLVLSDLYDRAGFRRGFDLLRHRGYGPRLVQIHDRREAHPGRLGDLELADVEGGAVRPVTVTERSVRRYRVLWAEHRQSVREYCRKHQIPCLQIACDVPAEKAFAAVLGQAVQI